MHKTSKESQKIMRRLKRSAGLVKRLVHNPHQARSMKAKIQIWCNRLIIDMIIQQAGKIVKDTKIQTISLNGIPSLKLSAPNSDPHKALVYFHGGAYCLASPNAYTALGSQLALASGMTVYLAQYRLAPEHYFPAQLEDSVKSYEALENLGFSPNNIALGGDSAGGNLTVITLLKLKERGIPLPAAAICISPWLDPAGHGETYTQDMISRDLLLGPSHEKLKYHYHATGLDVYAKNTGIDDLYLAPLQADFSGFPPIMIQVGSEELLLSDATTARDKLVTSGSVVEYVEWAGLWHVFQMYTELPESKQSFELFGQFLRKYVGKSQAQKPAA